MRRRDVCRARGRTRAAGKGAIRRGGGKGAGKAPSATRRLRATSDATDATLATVLLGGDDEAVPTRDGAMFAAPLPRAAASPPSPARRAAGPPTGARATRDRTPTPRCQAKSAARPHSSRRRADASEGTAACHPRRGRRGRRHGRTPSRRRWPPRRGRGSRPRRRRVVAPRYRGGTLRHRERCRRGRDEDERRPRSAASTRRRRGGRRPARNRGRRAGGLRRTGLLGEGEGRPGPSTQL